VMTSFDDVHFPREWINDNPQWTRDELGVYYIEGAMTSGFYHWDGFVFELGRWHGIRSRYFDNDCSVDEYLFMLDFWVGNRPASCIIDIFRRYLKGREDYDNASRNDIKELDERMGLI